MGTLQKPAVVACQRQQLGALLGGEWGGEREQSGRGAWHTTARAAWVMKMVAPGCRSAPPAAACAAMSWLAPSCWAPSA